MNDTYVPKINPVTFTNLKTALKLGFRDFVSAPLYGLFFAGIYVAGGVMLIALMLNFNLEWAIYPLAIGFALIGPFIATGLYETSRRRELGLPLSFRAVLGVIWDQKNRELGWMAFVMLFVFWVWMYQARTIFVVFFGSHGFASFEGFMQALFTTPEGMYFLVTGHIVGAAISLILFSLTVISCPLLLDRDIDFVTAMVASIRCVFTSPLAMVCWGSFVIASVLLSMLPGFLGLLVTLPVLGHSTWHLYRIAVKPA